LVTGAYCGRERAVGKEPPVAVAKPVVLRLAGPRGGGAVGLGPRGHGVAVLRLAAVDETLGIREGSLAEPPQSLSRAGPLAVLSVRGQVERDEQHEVRAEDADPREGGELLARALARVGHPREVGRGEVGVRGEVHEA